MLKLRGASRGCRCLRSSLLRLSALSRRRAGHQSELRLRGEAYFRSMPHRRSQRSLVHLCRPMRLCLLPRETPPQMSGRSSLGRLPGSTHRAHHSLRQLAACLRGAQGRRTRVETGAHGRVLASAARETIRHLASLTQRQIWFQRMRSVRPQASVRGTEAQVCVVGPGATNGTTMPVRLARWLRIVGTAQGVLGRTSPQLRWESAIRASAEACLLA